MVGGHPRLPIPPQAHESIIVGAAYGVNGKILWRIAMAERKDSASGRTQTERFEEAARSLGCNEDEAAFKTKLAVIARQKPKGEQEPVSGLKKDRRRG